MSFFFKQQSVCSHSVYTFFPIFFWPGTLMEQPTMYEDDVITPENLQRFNHFTFSKSTIHYLDHSSLSNFLPLLEPWRLRSWGGSTSRRPCRQSAYLWFTPSLMSLGWAVGSTTSCTARTPLRNIAKQYVSQRRLIILFHCSMLVLYSWKVHLVSLGNFSLECWNCSY